MALDDQITRGTRVRVERLENTLGMLVPPKYLDNRRLGSEGVVHSWVPGHGGDVWFVDQDDGSVAVYSTDELQLVDAHKE